MAEEQQSKPLQFFRGAWGAISAYGNLQTLGSMTSASLVANYVVSQLPSGWHQPQYWTVAATAFSGTWFAVALAVSGSKALWRRAHPPRLEVSWSDGGRFVVTVVNTGAKAEVRMKARIVEVQPQVANHAGHWVPLPFRADLIGTKRNPVIDTNESGGAEVARFNYMSSLPTLEILETGVRGTWATVAIQVTSVPPLKSGPMAYRFKIEMAGAGLMKVTEVTR